MLAIQRDLKTIHNTQFSTKNLEIKLFSNRMVQTVKSKKIFIKKSFMSRESNTIKHNSPVIAVNSLSS